MHILASLQNGNFARNRSVILVSLRALTSLRQEVLLAVDSGGANLAKFFCATNAREERIQAAFFAATAWLLLNLWPRERPRAVGRNVRIVLLTRLSACVARK